MNKNKNEVEEKKIETKNNLAFFTMVIVVCIIVLLVINFLFSSIFSGSDVNSDITKVKKILNEKYTSIDCINSSCKYVVAIKGDQLKKTNYQIFNLNGKKISDFTVDNSKKNYEVSILGATENYVVIQKIKNEKITYIVKDRKGKDLYTTNNNLNILNEKYLVVNKKDSYSIISTKGKVIYDKISNYSSYYNGKYVSINKNNKNSVLNYKMKKVLKNYEIAKDIVNNNELLYLIVKNNKNNLYYYYNIKNNKIVGKGFVDYSDVDKKSKMTITRLEDDKKVKYVLDKNGNQEKLALSEDQNQIKSVIKEKVDNDKYYLYSYGIKDPNQDRVLVDNKDDRSFGILNIKTNNYKKLYSYKGNSRSSFSSVIELNSYNNYVQINCSISNCDEPKTYIYDLENDKEIYSQSGTKKVISNYIQYDGYKMIQYSKKSEDYEISGKYVLYDNDDKKIFSSDNFIYVTDKKLKFGNIPTSYIILYSIKEHKAINDEKSLATKVTLGDSYVFNYKTDDNNIIYTSKGKEVAKIGLYDYITYSNSNIIYIFDSKVYVYNANRNKTRSYKLKSNEKLNLESSKEIKPYRGAIFINNTVNREMKILNSKARIMRKSKNVIISDVKINKEDGVALIIVKKINKAKEQYGLYIAK